MELSDYAEPLAQDVAFWAMGLGNPDYPIDQMGRIGEDVSDKLRALAVIVLLTAADTDKFHHNLIRSALWKENFLRRCRDESHLDDPHRALGRGGAFHDAIAAGDFARALLIDDTAADDWNVDWEYEEDHCFHRALAGLLRGDEPDSVVAWLDRVEQALEGDASARLAVGRALLEGDSDDFAEAFEARLTERDDELEKQAHKLQDSDPIAHTESRVFVEGLALLRIAAERGIQTGEDYRYCPELARAPMQAPFPGE